MNRLNCLAGIGLCLGLALSGGAAENPGDKPAADLGDLSIEQLMNEPVTSVAKKETSLFQSPAAIAVVTDDDIRRMDFTSIPEALRFVPGLDVARVSGSEWAVASRGSNSQFSADTLVLVDGRTIYSPSFGGVLWSIQGMPMQDIDRIEVIRGPGSTLWGANAFNGVINVISKSARETQGLLASASEGTEDNPSVTIRYGGKAGESVYYRAYVNLFNRNGMVDAGPGSPPDFSHGWRTGLRLDAIPSAGSALMLEGEVYGIRTGGSAAVPQISPPSMPLTTFVVGDQGGHLLGKWTKHLSETSQWSAQTYYDHGHSKVGPSEEYGDMFDLELQDSFAVGARQAFVVGLSYRYVRDNLPPSALVVWNEQFELIHLYSTFVQDEITLAPDRLRLIPGAKIEHNDFTGFEFEPGIRLLWTPAPNQTVWLGATRAVRTPTFAEVGARVALSAFPTAPGGPPAEIVSVGNPNLNRSEKVTAYEAGYRLQPTRQLSFDFTVFYNAYSDLINTLPPVTVFSPDPPPPRLLIISSSVTNGTGACYGVEPAVQWRLMDRWRLIANYTLLHQRFSPDNSETQDNPQHQFRLLSYFDCPGGFEVNGGISYVGKIVDTTLLTPLSIPAYVRIDLGVIWRPSPSLEIGIWGQNLGASRHVEFGSQFSPLVGQVPRGIATRITWRH